VPAAVTVMDALVAAVLHNKDPVNDPAVNVELPQLFTTVTVGADTLAFNGAATPLPGELVHPLKVCVAVYVPAAVTVMEGVVAPVLHSSDPVNEFAVSVELPQLLTTDITGAEGMALTVSVALPELTELVLLVQTALYCLLLSSVDVVKVNVATVAPLMFVHVVPFVLTCHCTVGVGVPPAAEVKVALLPAHRDCEEGCKVMFGAVPPPPEVVNTTSTQ